MAKVIRYTKYGYEIYDTQTMSYKPLDLSYIHVSEFNKGKKSEFYSRVCFCESKAVADHDAHAMSFAAE